MNAAARTLQRYAATKSFRVGLGVAGTVYCALFAFLWFKGTETTDQLYSKLASQVVPIEREKINTAQPQAQAPAKDKSTVIAPSGIAAAHEQIMAPVISLTKAPIDGLSEDLPDGSRLPKMRDADKLTPFNAYRRPYTAKPGMPIVAIAVIDYGLSDEASKNALSSLSPDVSMVMTPYTKAADYWVKEARDKGHEVWLELPVETDMYPRDDSGPQTLLMSAIEKQNLKKLNWVLSQAQGYAGLATLYQPTFMKSDSDAKPVLNALYSRGLGFIDGETAPSATIKNIAITANAPYDNVDVWIDIPATPAHMAASLRQLEVLAQSNGSAIGFLSSTPAGLKSLQTWIDGLPQKNITLVPLSAPAQKAK